VIEILVAQASACGFFARIEKIKIHRLKPVLLYDLAIGIHLTQ
jgi:hypothetical protein